MDTPTLGTSRKHFFNERFFDIIDTESKAYFLGLLYADGCVSNRSTLISLHAKDQDILDSFRDAVQYTADLRCHIQKSRRGVITPVVTLRLHSVHMYNRLVELGCVPAKTHKIRFPVWMPTHLENHFIRGYFDGDGSISSYETGKNRRSVFDFNITSNASMCQELSDIIGARCDVSVYLYRDYKKYKSDTTSLKINGHDQIKCVMRWLYKDATIFMKRKHDKYLTLEARVPIDVRRPVYQLDKQTGAIIAEYESVVAAARALGTYPPYISKVCRGGTYKGPNGKRYVMKSIAGFKWRYADGTAT